MPFDINMSGLIPDRKVKYGNVPEFKGPIEVQKLPGKKGRGVIATEDIAAGQLVLISRAFEIDFESKRPTALEEAVIEKISQNPHLLQEVLQLHAGEELGHINKPNNDEMIKVKGQETPLDQDNLDRIRLICEVNPFGSANGSRGLWILPSYLNHDCIDFNCIYIILGDLLFIRAVRGIPKGSELVHSYIDSTKPYLARLEFFESHDFVCECRLCLFQAKEEVSINERKFKIFKNVQELSRRRHAKGFNANENFKKLNEWMTELEEIGVASGKPEWNFSIAFVLAELGILYQTVGDLQNAQIVAEKYYNVVNGCPREVGEEGRVCFEIEAARGMLAITLGLGDFEKAQKWVDILINDLTLGYGKSNVFKYFEPDLYYEATKNGLDC